MREMVAEVSVVSKGAQNMARNGALVRMMEFEMYA